MNIQMIYGWALPFFRKRRMKRFAACFSPSERTRILDVGGYPWFWENAGFKAEISILNTHVIPGLAEQYQNRYDIIVGDGTQLTDPDQSIDILFSNSVIEHLGTFEHQKRFAAEAMRVGKKLWVQTPAKVFFLEPHLLTPFIHWLPRSGRKRLLRYFTVWGLLTKPSNAEVESLLNEIRLLTASEMRQIFPGCRIHTERFLGWPKSYIAIRE